MHKAHMDHSTVGSLTILYCIYSRYFNTYLHVINVIYCIIYRIIHKNTRIEALKQVVFTYHNAWDIQVFWQPEWNNLSLEVEMQITS